MKIEEQERVLKNDKKNMIVSASAGSGKTYVLIEYISRLVCQKRVPIKKLLILTFTKQAALEMKERLVEKLKKEVMKLKKKDEDFLIKQIDDLSVSNISTIHSFCEYCLKKYANILKINENFEIADENLAKKIKFSSLKQALKKFEKENADEMTLINFAFKYDENKLNNAIFEIEQMAHSVSDKDKYIDKILTSQQEIYKNAEQIVKNYIDDEINSYIKSLELRHFGGEADELKRNCFSVFDSASLIEKIENVKNLSLPKFPKKEEISEEENLFLGELKEDFKKFKERLTSLNLTNEKVESEKKAELEKALVHLFLLYCEEYEKEKESVNLLDFNDLEQYMLKLSFNKVFKEEFLYVFIDEYQDTNSLQEKIVKKVAENCNFVAVGDAKQGIYGFRLASSKIFLKDVEEFEKDENGNALFLKLNFRSDKRVLNFVNSIFKNTMTVENSGINYLSTSMLQNVYEFENDNEKSVVVDIVSGSEKEKNDFEIYSVKEDEMEENLSMNEMEVCRAEIERQLKTQIYDNKQGVFRPVKYSDIAIISRSRNQFFNDLGKFLLQSGIPVTTMSKKYLSDTPEIKILIAVLKIALSQQDNLSLLSVLMSNFGKFNQDEILQICQKENKNLCEIVKNNEKFADFLKKIEDFKNNGLTFGYRRAFEILFEETNYYPYIFSQYDGEELYASINLFLNEIEKSGFMFDLPNLISYFENVSIEDNGVAVGENDSVLLTTIHKTKGLEYPIVMIINAGKSLKRAEKKGDIRLDDELGLATKFYEGDLEEPSIKMFAIDLKNEKKRFQEEMMIFYVALTRAKNRLIIVGENKKKDLKPLSVKKIDSYFDYIFSTLASPEIEKLLSEKVLEKDMVTFNIIEKVENLQIEKNDKKYGKIDEKIVQNVQNYLNFKYLYENKENISFKNSVTGLTKKYEDDNVFQKNNEFINVENNVVEIGNAYHYALKILDFEKIENLMDVTKNLQKSMEEEQRKLINMELLYNNILTLKPYCNGKVFKEQEFIMKDSLCNLIEKNSQDEIMVQGIIDFFAVKENGSVILIDYKYSTENNPEKLINRYKLQLKLYKNAIESGLNLKVNEVYLLNLRFNNLIKVSDI